MKLHHIILTALLLSFTPSCKSLEPADKEGNLSEVDAVNIPKFWQWLTKHRSAVAKQLAEIANKSDDLRSSKRVNLLLPLENSSEVVNIIKHNKSQIPTLIANLNKIDNGAFKMHHFLSASLPEGIPAKYKPGLEVLKNSIAGDGAEKIAVRRFSAQLVEKYAKSENITLAVAYERNLKAFTRAEFGIGPQPLPDAFVDANVFFGHLVEKRAPFLDVAFGPGGSLGPDSPNAMKSAHGVYVHIEDFFEWSVLCRIHSCGSASIPELMQYVARSGLAETAINTLKQKEAALAAGKLSEVAKLDKQLKESIRLLRFHSDGRELQALRRGETVMSHDEVLNTNIPLRLLDWESHTPFRNGTNLWDVYFDFQNLADEAFKDSAKLQAQFGNPKPGFLAFSMHVASNPMYMGRANVLNTFFKTLGWH